MLALYIIGGIILLILLILLLPITAQLRFNDDFSVRIKFLGITVYKLKPDAEKEKTESKEQTKNTKGSNNQEKGLFTRLKDKHGFKGAIKEIFTLLLNILKATKKYLLKIKFRKVKMDLIVVGSDAAMTAIDYGAVCSLAYPLLSFIDQNLNVKLKQINIEAGFKHKDSQFSFSADVKANAVLLLIIAFKAFKEYQNFSVRNELQ